LVNLQIRGRIFERGEGCVSERALTFLCSQWKEVFSRGWFIDRYAILRGDIGGSGHECNHECNRVIYLRHVWPMRIRSAPFLYQIERWRA